MWNSRNCKAKVVLMHFERGCAGLGCIDWRSFVYVQRALGLEKSYG